MIIKGQLIIKNQIIFKMSKIIDFEAIEKFLQIIPQYYTVDKCKAAGIVPFSYDKNGELIFLLQKNIDIKSCPFDPNKITLKNTNNRKRNCFSGWNDFGGKNEQNEDIIKTAIREFNEETSLMFYFAEINDTDSIEKIYNLNYEETIKTITNNLTNANDYYINKLKESRWPPNASSKDMYVTYFMKVPFLDADILPKWEDLLVNSPKEEKFKRLCKWFTVQEIFDLPTTEFHSRLQIVKFQKRLGVEFIKGTFKESVKEC